MPISAAEGGYSLLDAGPCIELGFDRAGAVEHPVILPEGSLGVLESKLLIMLSVNSPTYLFDFTNS